MSKVYIGVGHGGSDPGAVANGIKEKDLTLDISKALRDYLARNGVETRISRETDKDVSINWRVNEANKWRADLFVEVHINAGGGDGAEVYHTRFGGRGKTLAQNILNAICKLGQQSRGTKTKVEDGSDYFGVIRETNMPAVLVECAFIDTKDVWLVDTHAERVQMGEAIGRGVLKTLGRKETSVTKPATTTKPTVKPNPFKPYKVRITTDVLRIRKGPGTNTQHVGNIRDRGVYTIICESKGAGSTKGWGKLKSGAGWISLDYTKKF
jgi:N-acetylmuramoyl-L-alanine amidase